MYFFYVGKEQEILPLNYCRRDGYGFKYFAHTQNKCQKMTHI